MSNEEMFEQGKKTKDQEYAEMKINEVIRSMKGKIILFSVGALLLALVGFAVIPIIGALPLFGFFYFSIHIFTDFPDYSRNALSDWKKFLENEDEFWEIHKKLKNIVWQ